MKNEKRTAFIFSLLIWFLSSLFYFHQYFLLSSISPMIPKLEHDFSLSPLTISAIAASFYYVYLILQFFTGYFTDRFGTRYCLSFASLACGMGAIVFANAQSVGWLYTGRILIGVGAAFSLVGTLTLARNLFTDKQFTLLNGITAMTGVMGVLIGTGPASIIIDAYGWRFTMNMGAIIAIAISITIFTFFKKHIHTNKHQTSSTHYEWRKVVALFKKKNFWLILVYTFGISSVFDSFVAFWAVPFISEKIHATTILAAKTVSLISFGYLFGAFTFSWCASHYGHRKSLLAAGAFFIGLTLAGLIYLPSLTSIELSMLAFVFGISLGSKTLAFVVMAKEADKHITATAMALVEFTKHFGGVISLLILGCILEAEVHSHHITPGHLVQSLRLDDYYKAFIYLMSLVFVSLLSICLVKEKLSKAS